MEWKVDREHGFLQMCSFVRNLTFNKIFIYLTVPDLSCSMWGLVVLCFRFFDLEACGILPPQPGIKSTPPALDGEVLTTVPMSQIAHCRDQGLQVRLRTQGIQIQAHLTAMPVLFIQTGFQNRCFAFPPMTPGNQCERAVRCSLTSQGSLLEAALCLAVEWPPGGVLEPSLSQADLQGEPA